MLLLHDKLLPTLAAWKKKLAIEIKEPQHTYSFKHYCSDIKDVETTCCPALPILALCIPEVPRRWELSDSGLIEGCHLSRNSEIQETSCSHLPCYSLYRYTV